MYGYTCKELQPLVYFKFFSHFWPILTFSNLPWWPPVTFNDIQSQNNIHYTIWGYHMGIKGKKLHHWLHFTIVTRFDLFWPPVTSNDLWVKNNLVYNSCRYHTCLYCKNHIPGWISNVELIGLILAFFDLSVWPLWPQMTLKVKLIL